MLSITFVVQILVLLILLAVLILAGRWFIAQFGLGQPWPTILGLLVLALLLIALFQVYPRVSLVQ